MSWSFGVSKNVPVLNLTDDLRRSIMYPCANAGIIYEFEQNTQIILQGHVSHCLYLVYSRREINNKKIFR